MGVTPLLRRQAQRNQLNASDADRPLTWWLDVYVRSELGDDTRHKRYEASHVRLGLAELEMTDQPPASVKEDNVKTCCNCIATALQLHVTDLGQCHVSWTFCRIKKVIQSNPAQSVSKKRRPKPPAPEVRFMMQKS